MCYTQKFRVQAKPGQRAACLLHVEEDRGAAGARGALRDRAEDIELAGATRSAEGMVANSRIEAIGELPAELRCAGLRTQEWLAIDSGARRRAKNKLGKCKPAKIVEKIRAILADHVSDEAGLVQKLSEVDLSAAAHHTSAEAQPLHDPPTTCSRQVVEGQGGLCQRVNTVKKMPVDVWPPCAPVFEPVVASTPPLGMEKPRARPASPLVTREVVDGERWQQMSVGKAWEVVRLDYVEEGALVCGCASVTRAPEWDPRRRPMPVMVACNYTEPVSWRCACGLRWVG